MTIEYAIAESVAQFATNLIASQHPHLATANIDYLFVDKEMKSKGRPLYGKVSCPGPLLKFYTERDFIVEVSGPSWNELTAAQRNALVDHLLERCGGEEDEDSGEMKWKLREPDVQEFGTILHRHGVWHDGLKDFVQVAQTINLDAIIEEETVEEMDVTGFLNTTEQGS
jgi:hypothetical protein